MPEVSSLNDSRKDGPADINDRLEQFETAWRTGTAPSLDAFLPPSNDPAPASAGGIDCHRPGVPLEPGPATDSGPARYCHREGRATSESAGRNPALSSVAGRLCRALSAGRRRRGLGADLGGLGLGRGTFALAHGNGYLRKRGAKTAGASQEGNGDNAFSPTGATQRWAPLRVTKDRVAASRARRNDGHAAAIGSTATDPRRFAQRSRSRSPREAAAPSPVHGLSGPSRAA